MTGPSSKPDSSIQVVPVISPLPLSANQPANTGSADALPRGRTAVTPVRTGPVPTFNSPSPLMIVTWPTSTPLTSVMALSGPGVPSKGMPRPRARGLPSAATGGAVAREGSMSSTETMPMIRKTNMTYLRFFRPARMIRHKPGAQATGRMTRRLRSGLVITYARISRMAWPPWPTAKGRPPRSGTVISGSMPRQW